MGVNAAISIFLEEHARLTSLPGYLQYTRQVASELDPEDCSPTEHAYFELIACMSTWSAPGA